MELFQAEGKAEENEGLPAEWAVPQEWGRWVCVAGGCRVGREFSGHGEHWGQTIKVPLSPGRLNIILHRGFKAKRNEK